MPPAIPAPEALARLDTPNFSTSRFRAEREADWIAFETLLGRLERKGAKALTSDELLQLPSLYRATLSSLSIARATSLDRALLDYLESLSMRGYFLIYGVRQSRLDRLARFWPPRPPLAAARPVQLCRAHRMAAGLCAGSLYQPAGPAGQQHRYWRGGIAWHAGVA